MHISLLPDNRSQPTFIIFILVGICAVFLSSCSSPNIQDKEESEKAHAVHQPGKYSDVYIKKYQDAVTALQANNYTEAEKLFSEIVTEAPNNDSPYCNLAIIYFKAEDYNNASKLVDRAIELNSNNAQAYNLRAQISIKKAKIKDAESDYRKAIQLKPDYVNAQYNLALLYDIYLQDLEKAIKHYEIYLSLLNKPDQRTQEWVNHLKGSLNNG